MKELPKEFQFKCDEHSLEQCKKLGIDVYAIPYLTVNNWCKVSNNVIIWDYCFENDTDIIISLSDYIESETDQSTLILDKLDKIIQLLESRI